MHLHVSHNLGCSCVLHLLLENQHKFQGQNLVSAIAHIPCYRHLWQLLVKPEYTAKCIYFMQLGLTSITAGGDACLCMQVKA